MTIVEILVEKPFFLIMDFECSYEVLLRHKVLLPHNFIRTFEIHYKKEWFLHKNFDNSHLKFGKMKKLKIKK